jgi:hypothetical protein
MKKVYASPLPFLTSLKGTCFSLLLVFVINAQVYAYDVPPGATRSGDDWGSAVGAAIAGEQVTGFTLFNADTKQAIQTLSSGSTLNLAALPTRNLNIRATTSPSTVGSVVFALSGAQSKSATESMAPYDLMGDNGAWTPAEGSYTLKATPYSAAKGTGTAGTALTISFTVVNSQEIKVNFQPSGTTIPAGYIADTGLAYDNTRGFGWIDGGTRLPKINDLTRYRNSTDELRLRSYNHLQHSTNPAAVWEYKIANGTYQVTVSAGDADYLDSKHTLNVERVAAISGFVPTSTQKYKSGTVTVTVSDGKLTIDAVGGTNSKMNYVTIAPAPSGTDQTPPTVAVRLAGTLQAENSYRNQVEMSVVASDEGGSGLASTQYSLNGGTYQNYVSPVLLNTPGDYTVRAKAVDGKGNQTITALTSFKIVRSTNSNALLFLENRDKFPNNDNLTFSRIQNPWSRDKITYNANHDLVTLRIHNKGISSLVIGKLTLSNTAAWVIETLKGAAYDPATALPLTIGPGSYADVALKFIAPNTDTRVKVLHETLTIESNDDKNPRKQVFLHGLAQRSAEGSREPVAKEIIAAFGFKTNVGFSSTDPDKGDPTKLKGDEILSSYFVRADQNRPVHVRQMAAYHGCCTQSESLRWHAKGSTTKNGVVYHIGVDAQSLLPRRSSTGTPAEGSFSPTSAFGLNIGTDWTDRTKNPGGLIGVRVWKAIDLNGNIIPNAYIIANDYLGTSATNYDYNDNVYYVTNIQPEAGPAHYSALRTAPSALDFNQKAVNSSNTLTLNLSSLGKVYSNGSQDPALQISSVKVVGENQTEFSATMPAKTVLNPGESTTLTVKFTPAYQGFKVADLLIYYNNSQSPHRVPLYGIGLNSNTTVSVHERINSGSSTAVTINGKTWKADNQYAKDNLEPYRNSKVDQISATDEDAIYLVEQSSNADGRGFRYEIPVSNREYVVRLHFAEIYWGAPGGGPTGAGSRVFSVNIEGQPRLVNFDLVQEVGTTSAVIRNFPVSVTDGRLNINFSASANRPMVSAVEVYSLSTSTTSTSTAAVSSLAGEGGTKVEVYPNPLEDRFTVAFPPEYAGKVFLTVVDPAGRSIKVGGYELNAGTRRLEVNIGHLRLNRGFYYLRVESENHAGEVIKLLVR